MVLSFSSFASFTIASTSSAARSQTDSRRCLRQTLGLRGHCWARIPPCRASHLRLAETVNVVLPVHTFSLVESPFSKIRGRDSRYEQLSQCLDAALISAALHYGLPYGCSPATGNFQQLRGRPPLVSPLKSCMGRSFTAVAMGRIAIGTAYAPRSFSSRNR